MKNKIIFGIFILTFNAALAQNYKIQQSIWFSYTGFFKFSNKWGSHIELQIREDDAFKQSKQNLFRIGLIYYLNSKTNFTAGFGKINTLNPTLNIYFDEDRIWQQVTFILPWRDNKNSYINRIRLEQRFVEHIIMVNNNLVNENINYQNRLRYFTRNTFAILKSKTIDLITYAFLQNEIFLNIGGNNLNNNVIDQNRFLMGIGINHNSNSKFEIGYMNQFINLNGNGQIMNHTLVFSLTQNINFL